MVQLLHPAGRGPDAALGRLDHLDVGGPGARGDEPYRPLLSRAVGETDDRVPLQDVTPPAGQRGGGLDGLVQVVHHDPDVRDALEPHQPALPYAAAPAAVIRPSRRSASTFSAGRS